MTQQSNETRHPLDARSRQSNAAVAPLTVAHGSDNRQPLSARPLVLITRGRVEYTAKCPGCSNWHRHRHLGDVRGPCGTRYELQPRRRRRTA